MNPSTTVVAYGFEAGSQMAHAIATAGLADAFAGLGRETILITAGTGGRGNDELRALYGLRNPVRWLPVAGFSRHSEWFAALTAPMIASLRPGLVHTRDLLTGIASARMGFPTVVEAHPLYVDENFRVPSVTSELAAASTLPCFLRLLVLGNKARTHYAKLGVAPDKIRIEPGGVDRTLFSPAPQTDATGDRKARPVALYSGHLYDWKGIPTLLGAASRLPDVDFRLVGGHDEDVARVRARVSADGLANVELLGPRARAEIPEFLRRADVALVPASGRHWTSETSAPLKLGEAFAVGTPVVASDIPALLDIGARDAVCPVAPDDPDALAAGIRRVLDTPDYAASLSARGRAKTEDWDVNVRASRMLDLARSVPAPDPDQVYWTLCGGWFTPAREA